MKYKFENTDKCDNCGDITSEKCGLNFCGIDNVYCVNCKNYKLKAINDKYHLNLLLKSGSLLNDKQINND